ncbi:MAG: hypothetical protein ACO25B_01385 [Chitinophagaceae bacterium]
MAIFEHNFDDRTFKLILSTDESNCYLRFEIFDKEKYYLKTDKIPFYKKRITELIDILIKPDPWLNMRSFHFGHGNKSFLIYYSGTLMGDFKNADEHFGDEFKVAGLSGQSLADFLQQVLDS